MDVKEAIEKRRAYRCLEKVEITDDLINELVRAAQLSPSCFNNQPWRFIFVKSNEKLEQMKQAMNKGNEWTYAASMIIVVITKKEFDCIIKDREYYLFDTGLAVSAMILRATELNLVAHPIAGYSPEKVKEILQIPQDFNVITLIIVGKKSEKENNGLLNDYQVAIEKQRPERITVEHIYSMDVFNERLNQKVEHKK
ncbi:MAG: nitroreductase family protein [Candidatus Goldbacteria bacterium]|nr:nitroreductase family protein [Candidatus Goldiibacteriota bacterium]